MTTIEANYVLILQKQDEILSSLSSLEKHPAVPQVLHVDHIIKILMIQSFSFINSSHLPIDIPPPPSYPPQHFTLAEHYESSENLTPAAQPRMPFQPRPSHPPPSHPQSRENQMQPHTPFQPITNQSSDDVSQNAVATKKPISFGSNQPTVRFLNQ